MNQLLFSTDLHLDSCNDETFDTWINSVNGNSALIISGDISNSRRLISDLTRISSALKQAQIYIVLGNHDFYGGTINDVRSNVRYLTSEVSNLHYLSSMTRTNLQIGSETWELVGVDGWADGRAGDFFNKPSLIRDYQEVYDFRNMDLDRRFKFLNTLGMEEAFKLQEKLSNNIEAENILIVTHVPPYHEAHVFDGSIASPEYAPHFVCVSTGEVISNYALSNPNKKIHVVCGHTHQECHVKIMDNVFVHVGGAKYSTLTMTNLIEFLLK